MLKIKLFGIFLILVFSTSFDAYAKVQCWKNKSGTRECGDVVPPEYANQDITKYNNQGVVEKQTHNLTSEERSVKKEADAKKNAEQQSALESKRKDTALLSTYSNEKEIDLARDRSSQQIEARVSSDKMMLITAQESLAGHHKEQDDLLKQNKKIPSSLTEDIARDESRLVQLQKELTRSEQELAAIKARFDADKVRYRELKGAPPASK